MRVVCRIEKARVWVKNCKTIHTTKVFAEWLNAAIRRVENAN